MILQRKKGIQKIMRAIKKNHISPCFELARAHLNPPLSPSAATARWGRFKNKEGVLEALLGEQYFLCCYTEIDAQKLGLGFHIEHVENKGQNPARTFDYLNLAASGVDSKVGLSKIASQGETAFGGHAPNKTKPYDLKSFVSCHHSRCFDYFSYGSNGMVDAAIDLSPEDEAKARYTISLLNLNSPYLVVLRRKWWEELDTIFEEHLSDGDDIELWSQVELIPINGRLNPFFSMTRQFFSEIAESTLKKHAPELL